MQQFGRHGRITMGPDARREGTIVDSRAHEGTEHPSDQANARDVLVRLDGLPRTVWVPLAHFVCDQWAAYDLLDAIREAERTS
jgi:hypothetical protein